MGSMRATKGRRRRWAVVVMRATTEGTRAKARSVVWWSMRVLAAEAKASTSTTAGTATMAAVVMATSVLTRVGDLLRRVGRLVAQGGGRVLLLVAAHAAHLLVVFLAASGSSTLLVGILRRLLLIARARGAAREASAEASAPAGASTAPWALSPVFTTPVAPWSSAASTTPSLEAAWAEGEAGSEIHAGELRASVIDTSAAGVAGV